MKRFKTANNIFGWLTFLIAAITYCLTVEPSASFWDCPEFILSGNKLEVGHPPGAPFFMLTANFFSLFAEPQNVALMVNYMSAILSAAGILFLFWSITHLTRKLIVGNSYEMSCSQLVTIMGAGIVGALAYTWSDTYWFSAVEGEVYGYSSLFTAVVFWLILKWEENADKPHSDRWLVLIAYLVGLSIGVHLLNLLCIPAIVLVVYYKRVPNANLKGLMLALAASAVLVAIVLYGIVPGVVKVGGWFELLFVNTLGLPFNTGLITYIILLCSALIWGLYESERESNRKKLAIAFIASVGLLGIPFYGYGFMSIILGIVVLLALFILVMRRKGESYLVNLRWLNTSLLCMLVIMIGYSSYALIVVRSAANTPMDQNSPEDIFTLGAYLGREQYGSRPLLYGQAYSSEVERVPSGEYWVAKVIQGAPKYAPKAKATPDEKDSYEIVEHDQSIVYAQNMFFPRMYSYEHAHFSSKDINLYEQWCGGKIKGRNIRYKAPWGETVNVKMPTQFENIQFFINYQLNHMYWRYFLWNFVGRQNDLQSHGEMEKGNWITGIPFIDNILVGNQENLPDVLKNNKGRNVFFALPFILGVIGLVWQARRGKEGIQQFFVVFMLFFMTGIAIVLYLNQTPMQPRERDYAYAGSFYAFAIWIGLGVAAITEWVKKKSTLASRFIAPLCLLIPIQMVSQTWDDHDRSGRYACRDFGQNYLNTLPDNCAPIIFTCGDNDTFPLWYNQEVEGVRTDARVCNLSYLQTDWYIDQMRRPAYDSPSIPIKWDRIDYAGSHNESVKIKPQYKSSIEALYAENPESAKKRFGENPFEIKNIMKNWVRSKNENLHFIPTDTVYIKIDKEAVLRSGMIIPEEYKDTIPEYMTIPLKGRSRLLRSDLMLLEMLSQCNWERPLYMSTTVGDENYLSELKKFFVQEGLAYRITPFNWEELGYSQGYDIIADTERFYNNVINRFKFGGFKDYPDYYPDETISRMVYTHRRLIATLAAQLYNEGDSTKASNLLHLVEKELPSSIVPHNPMSGGGYDIGRLFIALGEYKEGCKVIGKLLDEQIQYLHWYNSFGGKRFKATVKESYTAIEIAKLFIEELNKGDEGCKALAAEYSAKLNKNIETWQDKVALIKD